LNGLRSTGPVALSALYLIGCSPVASFRPAAEFMPGNELEFGVGAVSIGKRPYVIEDGRAIGQLWISSEQSRVTNLSLIAAFDDQALAAGTSLRLRFLRTHGFVAAADAEVGFLFAGLSLPMSVRVVDEIWLYAAPRLWNWGLDPAFSSPLGVQSPRPLRHGHRVSVLTRAPPSDPRVREGQGKARAAGRKLELRHYCWSSSPPWLNLADASRWANTGRWSELPRSTT
jgi:hypothetical protein